VRAFGIYCTRSGQASRLWGYQAMPVLAVSNCRVVSGFATLCWVDMECANPRELGEFYRQVLGWDVTHYPDESAVITGGGTSIRFSRVAGYQPPTWPDSGAPKRYHMDLDVDDVAEAAERCLELGARQPDFQPGDGERWTVLLDPAGHPFCVCRAPGK
jgi:predicted enzyme related to lactoylglutathione lyase